MSNRQLALILALVLHYLNGRRGDIFDQADVLLDWLMKSNRGSR